VLKKYFYCSDDYPAIDFSQNTLLLAYGWVADGSIKIRNMAFSQEDTNLYSWLINFTDSELHGGGHFCVAILTPKIGDEDFIILNFTFRF